METKTTHGDGNHLTIDAFNCSSDLNNKELVENILNQLPELIGMNKITEPKVVRYTHENTNESGITGFVIVAESHIAIHTYPNKKFLSADIFSCKEFNYDKAIEYIKEKFNAEKVETNVISRGHTLTNESNDKLDQIKGFELSKDKKIIELLKDMKQIGFQATHLGQATEILSKIKKEKATTFLSFTSNMVSSGLREIFAQLVKHKLVDAIITSTGSIEEDLMKVDKPFLLGNFEVSDIELHKKRINRVGNIFIPDDRYEKLEDVLTPFFHKLNKEQTEKNKLISPSEFIYKLGENINDENSIFCPGITDGAIGLQLYFFKQKNPDFGIDVTGDMKKLADKVLSADKTAGIILGGGIAKHHLIGVNILREGLDYAIYVTTSSEGDGSLSGARPKEAKSWSKIKKSGNSVCIESDATIVFPLLATYMQYEDIE